MKANWLITTAAAAILASTGLAGAQGMNERGGAKSERGGAQSQMQGTEPRGGAQQRGQTTGQAPKADSPSRPSGQMQQRGQSGGASQAPDSQQPRATQREGMQQKGADQQKRDGAQQKGAEQQKRDGDRQQRGAEQQKRDGAQQKGAERDGDRQKGAQRDGDRQKGAQRDGDRQRGADQKRDGQKGAATTGRGDASGTQLTSEQRTKIRQVVVSKKIPQVTNVNFTVSVGARVPRTVQFHPIPVEIVEIYPAWSGYRVILVGSELVIVNPTSYEIVAVVVV